MRPAPPSEVAGPQVVAATGGYVAARAPLLAVSSLRGADGVDDTAVKYLLRAELEKEEEEERKQELADKALDDKLDAEFDALMAIGPERLTSRQEARLRATQQERLDLIERRKRRRAARKSKKRKKTKTPRTSSSLLPRSSSTTSVVCSWLVFLVLLFALCSFLLLSGPRCSSPGPFRTRRTVISGLCMAGITGDPTSRAVFLPFVRPKMLRTMAGTHQKDSCPSRTGKLDYLGDFLVFFLRSLYLTVICSEFARGVHDYGFSWETTSGCIPCSAPVGSTLDTYLRLFLESCGSDCRKVRSLRSCSSFMVVNIPFVPQGEIPMVQSVGRP